MLAIKTYHTLSPERAGTAGKDASGRDVRVVVKNQAFLVTLATSSPESPLDLSRSCVSAELLYDDVAAPRAVAYVRQRPLDFFTSSSTQSECTLELRARVLTSQHEDSLFRIRFTAMDTRAMVSASVISDPVRSISKAETLARRASRKAAEAATPSSSTSSPVEEVAAVVTSTRGRKRAAPEASAEQGRQIEDLKRSVAELELRLGERMRAPKAPQKCEAAVQCDEPAPVVLDEEERLARALVELVEAYSAVAPESRSAKVRRVAQALAPAQADMARATADTLFTAMFPVSEEAIKMSLGEESEGVTSAVPADVVESPITPTLDPTEEMMEALLRAGPENEDEMLQRFPCSSSWPQGHSDARTRDGRPSRQSRQ